MMTDEELKAVSEKLTPRFLAHLGRFTVMLAILDKSDQTPAGHHRERDRIIDQHWIGPIPRDERSRLPGI